MKINERKNNQIMMIVGFVILVLTVFIAFFKKDAMWLETMKVGGSANMSAVQKLYNSDAYKAQQTQAIQQVVGSIGQEQKQDNDVVSTLDKGKIDAIKKTGYFKGNKNATITIVEYSEMLCPYCKRQHESKVIEQTMEKFPGQVNAVFRNFIVHPQAKSLAEAAECVGSVKGDDAFYKFIDQGFAIQDYSEAGINNILTTIDANTSKVTSCIKDKKFSKYIDMVGEEGRQLFNITGTPGNVVINNENGKYIVIAGAYPVEKFIQVVEQLLQ